MKWFALSLKNYHLLLYRNITSNVNGSWMQKFHSSFIFLFVSWFSFTGTKSTFTCSKSSNRNTRKRCKICSKLTMKIPKRRNCCRSGVFIVNFEDVIWRLGTDDSKDSRGRDGPYLFLSTVCTCPQTFIVFFLVLYLTWLLLLFFNSSVCYYQSLTLWDLSTLVND